MSDPLDFGVRFKSAADRLDEAREMRREARTSRMHYNVTFLDDCLRGITKHDLVVIGARTGAGKTSLANQIAETNAARGKKVYQFALEAEKAEMENRLIHRQAFAAASRMPEWRDQSLAYPDWYLSDKPGMEKLDAMAEDNIRSQLSTLYTYYRETQFDLHDIERLFLAIQDDADLIVLDHLHYVDSDDDNENRAMKSIVKRIRDLSLVMGVPMIVVAHLRKRADRKMLVPELEEFHGASDITKIATRCIMMSRAVDQVSDHDHIAFTYMHCPKDRLAGAQNVVACMGFDLRAMRYLPKYRLGRVNVAGDRWDPIDTDRLPRWAKHEARRGQ